jgi:hypothetical protein
MSMRVFLSYAHADEKLARKLGDQLVEKGFHVWDPKREILPGDNWARELGDALERSDAVVVILSPDSVKSEWVKREIQFAIGDPKKEGRLFPVLARRPSEVPWILKRLNVLDASQGVGSVSNAIASALRASQARRVRPARLAKVLREA